MWKALLGCLPYFCRDVSFPDLLQPGSLDSPRTCAWPGLPTFAWILNDPAEWREAWALGVDGVMTDFVGDYQAWAAEQEPGTSPGSQLLS